MAGWGKEAATVAVFSLSGDVYHLHFFASSSGKGKSLGKKMLAR